jgi:mono/diheme cytochrome c family protein
MQKRFGIVTLAGAATLALGSLGMFGCASTQVTASTSVPAAGSPPAPAASATPAPAAAQGPKTSVWDGVFSEAQAKRGEALYAEQCASCHGQDLAGGEMAPGVVGADFYSGWMDLSLGDLSERIRVSMPQNNPQSLSRAQTADVLAFMLSRSSYPSGADELASQAEYLNAIKIEPKPAAQ